jgi:hypothetical protein
VSGVTSFCSSSDVSQVESAKQMIKTVLEWQPRRTKEEFAHGLQEMRTHCELEMVAR